MKLVDWYLTGKESTFTGAYDMRAPQVTLSPQMQKERENQIHYNTPTGKYGYNDSHAAESSTNTLETNKSKEKGNKGCEFVGSVPHDCRDEHSGQQTATTNTAQGTTEGESDEHKDETKILNKMNPVD